MARVAYTICAIAAAAVSTAALADGLGGKFGLGVIATSGNSSTSTANADLELTGKIKRWRGEFKAAAVKARSEVETQVDGVTTTQTQTTSERYSTSARASFDTSEHNYMFALVEYEKDLFGGVRERSSETLGFGRRLLDGEEHKLDIELGAGARQLQSQDQSLPRENDTIGRGALRYAWAFREGGKFTQALKVEGGHGNTYSESVSALKLAIAGSVYANLSYTVKHNSEVPEGSENVDTTASVSLSYEFGAE